MSFNTNLSVSKPSNHFAGSKKRDKSTSKNLEQILLSPKRQLRNENQFNENTFSIEDNNST